MNNQVFINCPFDESYDVMLHSMIFTIVSLGYTPRLSLECSDAGRNRLDKIKNIISEARISIHDLSKIKAESEGDYARMNMPFELGLDFGFRNYANTELSNSKKFLVVGGERYDYMKALSDISGIDIQYHDNDANKLILAIRDWFVTNEGIVDLPNPHEIWYKFMDFHGYYHDTLITAGYPEDKLFTLPIIEQVRYMEEFIEENPY